MDFYLSISICPFKFCFQNKLLSTNLVFELVYIGGQKKEANALFLDRGNNVLVED